MRFFCLALSLGLAVIVPTAHAEPHLEKVRIDVRDQRALASFHLADGLDDRFYERLESGLPTAFVYEMELRVQRRMWFDKTLETQELQVTAMYDALEREYLINYKLDGKLFDSRVVRELDELSRAMTRVEDVPAFDLSDLSSGQRLRVRLRATLGSKTVLAMIPSTITTDWVESRRLRVPAPPS